MSTRLSVILCTRNRASLIASWFERLPVGDLRELGAQLVLVDNGSSDATAELLRQHAKLTGLETVLTCEPRAGLGRARNAGLLKASGRIIVFADDDAYFSTGYFNRVTRVFETTSTAFVGGSIENWNPEDFAFESLRVVDVKELAPGTFILPGVIAGMNSCMIREVFDRIGFFDPLLGVGTPFPFEDIDYFNRASMAGFAGKILPELLVYHDHGRKPGSELLQKQRRGYALGRGGFYVKMALLGKADGLLLLLRQFLKNPVRFRHDVLGALAYIFYLLRHGRLPKLRIDQPDY